MDYKKYFDLTDALYEAYPDVWEDVCNLESPPTCKEGVDAADVTACGIPCPDSLGVTGGIATAAYLPQADTDYDGQILCGGSDVHPARYGEEIQGARAISIAKEIWRNLHYWMRFSVQESRCSEFVAVVS